MNLEEIKEDRKYCYAGVEYELEDCIDWLITEITRLSEEITRLRREHGL